MIIASSVRVMKGAIMRIRLQKAAFRDMKVLWEMQKKAFAELLEKYQDIDTSPANESFETLLEKYYQPQSTYYFLMYGEEMVGAIRIVDFKNDEKKKRISPIFVLPQYQNQGFAEEAISEVERIHGSHGWSLETILQEQKNCALYEKIGYRRTGKTKQINDKLTLIYYEKN